MIFCMGAMKVWVKARCRVEASLTENRTSQNYPSTHSAE